MGIRSRKGRRERHSRCGAQPASSGIIKEDWCTATAGIPPAAEAIHHPGDYGRTRPCWQVGSSRVTRKKNGLWVPVTDASLRIIAFIVTVTVSPGPEGRTIGRIVGFCCRDCLPTSGTYEVREQDFRERASCCRCLFCLRARRKIMKSPMLPVRLQVAKLKRCDEINVPLLLPRIHAWLDASKSRLPSRPACMGRQALESEWYGFAMKSTNGIGGRGRQGAVVTWGPGWHVLGVNI